MENRKIMVEVTEEEYEKIRIGILNEHIPTYEEVKKEVLKDMSFEDAKLFFNIHRQEILKSEVNDGDLIHQIIIRSECDKPKIIHDPISYRNYRLHAGTLRNIKKVDFSKMDEPLIETEDCLNWSLNEYVDASEI